MRLLIGDRRDYRQENRDEFLEMLATSRWKGGASYMSEFSFDDITFSDLSKEGDRYACEAVSHGYAGARSS